MKKLTFLVVLLFLLPGRGIAAQVSSADAVRAIAGEAEGEGARGMLGVACAIRNRGTLKGVYGLHAPRVRSGRVSPQVLRKAAQAWNTSKGVDITGGADHWHNLKREGPRKWTKKYDKTAVIGRHVFYKSNDNRRYVK